VRQQRQRQGREALPPVIRTSRRSAASNFTYNSSGVLETVTAGSESGYSGGGGVSTVVALPSWQSGVTGVITSAAISPTSRCRSIRLQSTPAEPLAIT